MFDEAKYETALYRVLDKIAELELEIESVKASGLKRILDTDNTSVLKKKFENELEATVSQYQKQIDELLSEYIAEVQPLYTSTDFATYQEAYKQKVLDTKPYLSDLSLGLIASGLIEHTKIVHNALSDVKRNNRVEVENLINKYTKKFHNEGVPREKLVLELARELKNLNVPITSISGNKQYKDIIAYARMSLKTASNHVFQKVSDQVSRDIGIPDDDRKVITTAHLGARPDHYAWQGKVFYFKELPEKTGYGTASGLLGVNCRHKFYTYIDGVTNEDKIVKIDKDEDERVYKANQELSGIERNIRKYKLAEIDDKKLGLKSSPATAKVKEWQKRANAHCKANGIARRYSREKVVSSVKTTKTTAKTTSKATASKTSKAIYLDDIDNSLTSKSSSIQYVKANSIEKAEEFAKSLGIDNANYRYLNLDIMNEVNKSLYDTITQFPEILQQLCYIGTEGAYNQILRDMKAFYKDTEPSVFREIEAIFTRFKGRVLGKSIADAKPSYNVLDDESFVKRYNKYLEDKHKYLSKGRIRLNVKYFGNKKYYLERLQIRYEEGFFSTNSIRHFVDHELGHSLDYLLELSTNKDIVTLFNSMTEANIKEYLSGYGSKQIGEFIAESWAEYRNSKSPRPIAKEIGEKIIELYNKKYGVIT